MQKIYCPKKSMFNCAWCYSHNTYILMKNDYNGIKKEIYDDFFDSYPKFPNGLLPYPPYKPEIDIDYTRPFVIIIKCDDCKKYSCAKSVICKTCKHRDIHILKMYSKMNLDDICDLTYDFYYECKNCKYYKPESYCEHKWIKVSGEIFSECTVSNLVCNKCGKKKTKYSNEDTYMKPWSNDEFSV